MKAPSAPTTTTFRLETGAEGSPGADKGSAPCCKGVVIVVGRSSVKVLQILSSSDRMTSWSWWLRKISTLEYLESFKQFHASLSQHLNLAKLFFRDPEFPP